MAQYSAKASVYEVQIALATSFYNCTVIDLKHFKSNKKNQVNLTWENALKVMQNRE